MAAILIIEDTAEMRTMLTIYLSQLGYEIFGCDNGLDGLKLAKSLKPDLIILDLMMPMASGDLTLGFLRSTEDLKDIPVIVASAHPKAAQIAASLGANVCLEKPYEFHELRRWIEHLTKNH